MREPSPIEAICRDWRQHHNVRRQGTHLLDRQEGLCSSCWAYIVWVRTEKGKVMPLDPWPDETGHFILTNYKDAGGRWIVHWARDEELEGHPEYMRYGSHFDTCSMKREARLEEDLRT